MCEMAIFKEKEARRSQRKVSSMEQMSLELMRVSRDDAETSVTARAAVSGREKNEVTRGRGRTTVDVGKQRSMDTCIVRTTTNTIHISSFTDNRLLQGRPRHSRSMKRYFTATLSPTHLENTLLSFCQ